MLLAAVGAWPNVNARRAAVTMSRRSILGVWVAVFAFIALAFGSLAYFSEDQYEVPSTQFEQGVIPPFRG
jgi:hypothetical protein